MKAIEIDPKKRYSHYSEMLHELNNPDKVEPYYAEKGIFKRNPILVCRIALILSLLANLALIVMK